MGFRNLGFRVSVEEIGKWISMSVENIRQSPYVLLL